MFTQSLSKILAKCKYKTQVDQLIIWSFLYSEKKWSKQTLSASHVMGLMPIINTIYNVEAKFLLGVLRMWWPPPPPPRPLYYDTRGLQKSWI